MENMELYNKVKTPPDGATKPITGGNLKGYTEINPQWRIQAMTETFGPCGIGWRFEVTEEKTFTCPDGKIMLYLEVALYYVDPESGRWSEPVYGWGGDFIIDKNKYGMSANDEAYKMALTDALGNAMKCLGVGADVFMGLINKRGENNNGSSSEQGAGYDGSKYSRDNYSERRESGPAPKQQQAAAQTSANERRNEHGELLITQPQQKRMFALAGKGKEEFVKEVLFRHGYVSSADVTRHDYNKICEEIQELVKAG